MKTYTENDIAIACAKRLSGQVMPIDQKWFDAVAHHGIELAENGAFTIELVNGQTFHVKVTHEDQAVILNDDPQRVCATCDEPVWQTGDGFADYTHADTARDNDHPAVVKLAHPMDNDPFAGIPGADNDDETW